MKIPEYKNVIHDDCANYLNLAKARNEQIIDLTFYDPPFNQKKYYAESEDNLQMEVYWKWMEDILRLIFELTTEGGGIYFMQREKNTHKVIQSLESTGWTFQNLIIWKKKSSAVPNQNRYGLAYQIIVYCIKGKKPRVFNKLRIEPTLTITQAYNRTNGIFITDVWDDIRELTSGYFAGNEPLLDETKARFHKQQSPIQLLLRIVLSSSLPHDHIFDPFAGTGTTGIVARQLNRKFTMVEKAKINYNAIIERLTKNRKIDDIYRYLATYKFTENLDKIWGGEVKAIALYKQKQQLPYKFLDSIIKDFLEIIQKNPNTYLNGNLQKKLQKYIYMRDYKSKVTFSQKAEKLELFFKDRDN